MKETKEGTVPSGVIPFDGWTVPIGWVVLLMLGVLAWTYFLERTACFDSAFFSWLMIDGEAPVSVLGRYGSWLPQLLPVALVRSGASLDTVLHVYSLSFIIFHALIFALLAFGMKDRRATIALPIVLTAGFHYMFYYGISELYQGLSLTVLLWAMICRMVSTEPRRAMWLWAIGIILLNIWISLYHQLLVLPLFFLLVFEAIPTGRRQRKRLILLSAFLLVWYVVRIKVMPSSSYEGSRIPTMADLFQQVQRIGELNSTIYLLMVWTKFKALLLVIALASGLALWQRAWLQWLWTMVFTVGFMVLILIVDRDGMSPIIYENYYPLVGLFWAVLFAAVLPDGRRFWSWFRSGSLVLICAFGLLQIHRAHYRISEKVTYSQRLSAFQAAHGSRKVLVRFNNYPWTYALGSWAFGAESTLCTAVKGPSKASALFTTDDVALLDTVYMRKEQFLGPSWSPLWFGLQNLDHRYFDLPRDTGYTWANTWVADFPFERLVVSGPMTPFRMFPDRFTVLPIEIHNPTDLPMPSCMADGVPFRLSYTLYRPDGSVYQEGGERTSLETDIPPGATYQQGLIVERPRDNGRYVVKVRMLAGDTPIGSPILFEVEADKWPF